MKWKRKSVVEGDQTGEMLLADRAVVAGSASWRGDGDLSQRIAASVHAAARARKAYDRYLFISILICIPVAGVLAFVGRQEAASIVLALFVAVIVGGVGLPVLRAHEIAVGELEAIQHIDAVGPLIDLLDEHRNNPDRRIRYTLMQTLERLLPRLVPTDVEIVTPERREALYLWLTPHVAHQHPRFVRAVMHAMVRLRDTAAIPHLKRLESMAVHRTREWETAEAAEACRTVLESNNGANSELKEESP